MTDLSWLWRKHRAICTAEFDQKATLAREMIAENFTLEESDTLEDIIDHFSTDARVAISIIGVLAQVGLAAMIIEDCDIDDPETRASTT